MAAEQIDSFLLANYQMLTSMSKIISEANEHEILGPDYPLDFENIEPLSYEQILE